MNRAKGSGLCSSAGRPLELAGVEFVDVSGNEFSGVVFGLGEKRFFRIISREEKLGIQILSFYFS